MDDWILEDVEINDSGTRDHLHGTHDGNMVYTGTELGLTNRWAIQATAPRLVILRSEKSLPFSLQQRKDHKHLILTHCLPLL
jgi:hypothetical protein